jgi:hypothetical protein
LLPEQQDILDKQAEKAKELVIQEGEELEALRQQTTEKLAALTEKRAKAQDKLDGVRRQNEDKQTEKLADDMELDGDDSSVAQNQTDKDAVTEVQAETEAATESNTGNRDEADMELEAADAGRGGREGDEVEY